MNNENVVKIVGIKKAPSTKDPSKTYYNYYYTGSFSEYEIEHADVQGISCGVEFASVDIGCHVGDEVEFKYVKGFQDKATLVGCTIVKPAAAPK